MVPEPYGELDSNSDVAKLEQWVARRYVHELNNPSGCNTYPLPPDSGPTPPESFTWLYDRCHMKAGNGGVFILDDDVVRFATVNDTETLSDGTVYSYDIGTLAKTAEQLSAAGAVATIPPVS